MLKTTPPKAPVPNAFNEHDGVMRQIRVRGRALLKLSMFGRSDPIVAMFLRHKDQWVYQGQTEYQHDTRDPNFHTLLSVRHLRGTGQQLKFSAYCMNGAVVLEKDRMGSAVVQLDELVDAHESQVCLAHSHISQR